MGVPSQGHAPQRNLEGRKSQGEGRFSQAQEGNLSRVLRVHDTSEMS